MAENQNLQGSAVIAKIFGVTTRRVEQLKTEGIIKGEGRPTRYDLLPTIQAYIKYLSDKANGREKKDSLDKLEKQRMEEEVKIKRAKAKKAELELKELEGQMHRAEDVQAVMGDFAMSVRSALLAMPGQLAVDIVKTTDAAQAAELIRLTVCGVLDDLAAYEYDPEEYARRVRERQGWQDGHHDDSDEDD